MVLIDIRENAAEEHIPGAYAVSPDNIGSIKGMLPTSKRDKKKAPIIVYSSGDNVAKAKNVAKTINTWGYKRASFLKGGFEAYKGSKDAKVVSNSLAKKIDYVAKRQPGAMLPAEFKDMIKNGIPEDVVLIDVRGASETKKYPFCTRFEETKNIPLDSLLEASKDFDKSKKYVISCATGARAKMGRDDLAKKGFKAFYVDGSYKSMNGGFKLGTVKFTKEEIEKINKM
jgi:rhodanese-related sulfurtransferase